ncbi:hypothetical protein [Streptomyces sp. NPDC001594]|uniref:hypothetical protein n=1 Tax=Streptomyces sp. NPDC001594 TaxID=3364590 RepID=UPI0036748C59
MSVQNTSSPLKGPEPEPRPAAAGPELKQCARCGRLGTRLFQSTPDGHVCTARAACVDRLLATR